MTLLRRTFVKAAALAPAAMLAVGAGVAGAQDLPTVKVGVLSFGTVNWEMDTIMREGFDTANGIQLEVVGFGGNEATAIALLGGEVDTIVTDAFWVSQRRAAGLDFAWVPHSLTVGGVIVRADSGIDDVEDLRGKRIAVAGGPADKSWLLLQAWTLDQLGENIRDAVGAVEFASPLLCNQMLENGDVDAVMNFWHWNSRLLAQEDYVQLIGTDEILDVLGVEGAVPLLGWAFSEGWAAENPALIEGFLKSSLAAKAMLRASDQAWELLRERMRATDNEALFLTLRENYRRGIVSSYGEADREVARYAFGILAKLGGEALMGESTELQPGTFWTQFAF
jgi:NitT/TauT family transport system substrate-binding protein